ncbi:MAG: DUF2207 domain-containing protein [Fodinibius sp.]|nr:DUF2207 domain-containing protein [Fodinibius sp.]
MVLRTLITSLLLVLVSCIQAHSKSYEIPNIRVEVTINEDGTVQITEHLTYSYDGSYSWAEYELPKSGYSQITNIQISEDGQTYINSNSEDPGTFSVSESEQAIRLKWHYNAKDERRTYTISYTLQDALTIGPEWSQLFWNFLSANRDKDTEQLDITITLPQSVLGDSLHGWTRGPKGHFELQTTNGTFSINASNLDDDDFAKVRALFPTSILHASKAAVTDSDFSLSQAREEEQTYRQKRAERLERQAELADLWTTINYLILALSVGLFYFLYTKYGKRHATSRFSDQQSIMIPGKLPPAVVGWLLSGRNITGNMLMASVLDLARQGYFTIKEEPSEEGFLSDGEPTFAIQRTEQEMTEDLHKWEQQIISYIEQELSAGSQKLHKIFENSNSGMTSWFSEWKQDFQEYCRQLGWIDQQSYTGCYINLAAQIPLIGASIAAIIYAGPIGLAALLTTALATICSFAIIRRTPEGEEVYHKWNNYKEGLKNAEEHNISTDILDKHFIYGIAFHLNKTELKNISSENPDAAPMIAWMIFSSDTATIADVAGSFSTLSATGSTAFPGAAGGAGASASAAGGGASASAG